MSVPLHRHEMTLLPRSERVILRPFIPDNITRVRRIVGLALAQSEEQAAAEWEQLRSEFESRHHDLESTLLAHYDRVSKYVHEDRPLSRTRQLLIGALFSGEYSIESAALFNPSIVPHPDQSELPEGAQRFVMSLRATGEGHLSSIEFRSGVVQVDGTVVLDPESSHRVTADVESNPSYRKASVVIKLREMGAFEQALQAVLEPLAAHFTRRDLNQSVAAVRASGDSRASVTRALEIVQWLADSNYELRFSPKLALSERVIFPVSANESNGIEDARFVRFVDDDGSVLYCATYTAYNGRTILPQMIETQDFLNFRVLTLNGNAVQNKGMALFPRRIDGKYAMLSRQDDENMFVMLSDNPHYWNDPHPLLQPTMPWEAVKIGNCGSPLELAEGWLVITHGVGAMRRYCMGAVLLDLHDPTQVIGRMREPLLTAVGAEREGYVPNVVYSCGAMLHGRSVILPFAMSDRVSSVVTVQVDDLLAAMR